MLSWSLPILPAVCLEFFLHVDGLVQERRNSSALAMFYVFLALTHRCIIQVCWQWSLRKLFSAIFLLRWDNQELLIDALCSCHHKTTARLCDGTPRQSWAQSGTGITHSFISFGNLWPSLTTFVAKEAWTQHSETCIKRPPNFVVSQDRWSFTTWRINMIL